MKSVRVWYKKGGRAKYISHLDINRCMTRVLQRAAIPVWRTEGFNPHPFITFALPLSLGFTGENESMDMRLTEDMPYEEIINKMNLYLPQGISVFDITEPVMKPGDISKADFDIIVKSETESTEELNKIFCRFFAEDTMITSKKTKSGVKDIDLKPHIMSYTIETINEGINIKMCLPAGSSTNINPVLVLDCAEKYIGSEIFCDITRTNIYNQSGEIFK